MGPSANPPAAAHTPYATAQIPTVNTTVTREVDTIVAAPPPARPTDLVRWGPILAGLFAALSTLATLTVLGLAIGASTFTPGASLGNMGLGAGIWGAVSALLAFGVGGWLAARSAAVGGHSNGILNGAMVWFVAIPLLLYLLSSGIGNLVGAAGSAAGMAAQAAAPPPDRRPPIRACRLPWLRAVSKC